MDSSRKFDLEELYDARKTASVKGVKIIDNSIRNIMNESPKVSSMRQDMINATRAGDTRAVKNLQQQIDHSVKDSNGGRYGW